jgi:DNA-binding transcriptional regulator YhcF (GntR family)
VSPLDLTVDRRAGVPLGAQLAARVRAAVRDGTLAAGDKLPSVRQLADEAGVNVNTARAVYARLESEGLVRSEQGRGTFVGGSRGDEATIRRELRAQIAELEAALTRLPPSPTLAADPVWPAARSGPALLTAQDLEAVRDHLLARLSSLDAQRAEVMRRLEQLRTEGVAEPTPPPQRVTPSLAGARIRWVGA